MATLPVFSDQEYDNARRLLSAKVATMLGRKMEEADWDFVYCGAKQIPLTQWSNVNVDVNYNGLGVEHKMLRVTRGGSILQECGTTKMHPAGTRSIRVLVDAEPQEAMEDVLFQYRDLIHQRTSQVRENSGTNTADMRFGWLLWKQHLDEFLYFEEPMLPPNPENFFAVWNETPAKGSRKESKSLWIFSRETRRKVYSVTTNAGAKIQPYFSVPDPSDDNLYHFKVQGVETEQGLVEVWLTRSTAKYLETLLGGFESSSLSMAIIEYECSGQLSKVSGTQAQAEDIAVPVRVTKEAYKKLKASYDNISDEYIFQQFAIDFGGGMGL